jgi:formate/nitrite transporter FocA (FNT family)
MNKALGVIPGTAKKLFLGFSFENGILSNILISIYMLKFYTALKTCPKSFCKTLPTALVGSH